jgi:nitroreductase
MDAIEALSTRRSVRKYKHDPVSKELLEKMVDSGRLAATALNVQPWEFVVIRDAGMRRKIAEMANYGRFIADAPACVVVLCKETKYYLEDGSAATQNMLVAARALGLGTCWVAGDKKEYADAVRRLVGAPDGYRLISMVSVGYPTEEPVTPGKRALSDVLHWEKY